MSTNSTAAPVSSGANDSTVVWTYPPEGPVRSWWLAMVTLSLCNCVAWVAMFVATRPSKQTRPVVSSHMWSVRYTTAMRYLALPFVFESTWRSFLPSLYNKRQTIVDSPVNSILIARMFAFVGEICWGIQMTWALAVVVGALPLRGSQWTQSMMITWIPRIAGTMLLFDVVANCCSVAGVVTTNYAFVVTEETLWAGIFSGFGICSGSMWVWSSDAPAAEIGSMMHSHTTQGVHKHHHNEISIWVMRIFVRCSFLFSLGAVPFMVTSDIPKWWNRYQIDEAAKKQYLDGIGGFSDAAYRRAPSQVWSDWEQDCFWMAGYFSVASFGSILMMSAPGSVRLEACHCHEGADNDATGGPIVAPTVG